MHKDYVFVSYSNKIIKRPKNSKSAQEINSYYQYLWYPEWPAILLSSSPLQEKSSFLPLLTTYTNVSWNDSLILYAFQTSCKWNNTVCMSLTCFPHPQHFFRWIHVDTCGHNPFIFYCCTLYGISLYQHTSVCLFILLWCSYFSD